MQNQEKIIHWRTIEDHGSFSIPANATDEDIENAARDCVNQFLAWDEDPAGLPHTPKIFHCVINNSSDEDAPIIVLSFLTAPGDASHDPGMALRNAVNDFVTSDTPEAKEALERACGAYNWGDVAITVPASFYIARGLTPLTNATAEVMVDHDEILVGDNK